MLDNTSPVYSLAFYIWVTPYSHSFGFHLFSNDPVMIPIHKTHASHKYAKVLCDQRFSVHIYPTN